MKILTSNSSILQFRFTCERKLNVPSVVCVRLVVIEVDVGHFSISLEEGHSYIQKKPAVAGERN